MADEGFAFGQRHLTDPLIEQGFLADQKTGGVQPAKDFILRGQKPAAELKLNLVKICMPSGTQHRLVSQKLVNFRC